MLDAQMRVKQFKESRADHRKQGSLPKEFRVGELFIRKILLGSPNSNKLAKTPPTWVRQGSLLLKATVAGHRRHQNLLFNASLPCLRIHTSL